MEIKDIKNDVFNTEDLGILAEYAKGYLMAGRQIPVVGTIDKKLTTQIASALLKMECEEVAPITLLIHTDGGSGGFLLENIINALQSPVDAIVLGEACSMGGIILQMCRKRIMLPQSEIYCHHPKITYSMQGRFNTPLLSDMEFLHQQALTAHKRQVDLFAKRTGKTNEQVEQVFRLGEIYNRSLTAPEALEFGLIDEICTDFKFFPKTFKGKKVYEKEKKDAASAL
jgi:ATP-dependent protease ClpP protease subunit